MGQKLNEEMLHNLLQFWAQCVRGRKMKLAQSLAEREFERGVNEAIMKLPQEWRDLLHAAYFLRMAEKKMRKRFRFRTDNELFTALNKSRAALAEHLAASGIGAQPS